LVVAYAEKKTLKGGKVVYYAVYVGRDGRRRTAGSFTAKRDAEKAADAQEKAVNAGDWVDPTHAKMTFRSYVETYYWPTTVHLEVSTRSAYRYYLDRHFLPTFGDLQMRLVSPSSVQAWVNDVSQGKLAPRSVVKYHALLHKIFSRAVIDRVVPTNPCAHTELPKVITQPKRIITVPQFEAILAGIPARYRTMVLVAIETGLRWGELVALRPCDVDFTTRIVTVRRTIVEVAKKNSPTGERCFVKDYPKDDEQREISIDRATCKLLREHMLEYSIRDEDLFFTTRVGSTLSRNNFRTKFWQPAVEKAKVKQKVTFHNLRAAHASWLLAGGADIIVVQERLGHRRITTTQQYTGTLPDAGERALEAFRKIRYGDSRQE
jgi:integrase